MRISAPVKMIFGADICVIGQRLKEERERLGYNQTDFAALAGAAKRTQIDWEKGVSSPTAEQLAAFAAAGADVLYILTGQRSGAVAPPPLKPDEAALLDNYRHSPPEGQAAIRATSAALAKPSSPKGRRKSA